MKILFQSDKECEWCKGRGTIIETYSSVNPKETTYNICKHCQGTGKKLEWQEVMIRSNIIYIL